MTDSDFGLRVLSGEETSPEEWQRHLQEAHGRFPGVTSTFCSKHRTTQGQTSYELLVAAAIAAARGLNRPIDMLDLACGDGYLIELALRQFGGKIAITGIDMAEGELGVARHRLAGENVRLYTGLAQSIPLPDQSVDVALSHLAFMLMVPIEPVVHELARVLRPGGLFSAVVPGGLLSAVIGESSASTPVLDGQELEAQRALLRKIQGVLRSFWQEEYPRMQTAGRFGDARSMTLDGWKDLFRPETGYTGGVEVRGVEILVKESVDGIWGFFKDTYLVDLLDASMQEKLRSRLTDLIVEHERNHGTLGLAFPLQQFSVRRR